jgi:hypothetical protein
MMAPIQTPTKELDIAFLVFVERYVSDLLKWDILTFFAHNPSFCASGTNIAQRLGRSVYAVRPDLGDLALLGILEQVQAEDGRASYRLTQEPYLRRMVLKFADPSAA